MVDDVFERFMGRSGKVMVRVGGVGTGFGKIRRFRKTPRGGQQKQGRGSKK